MPTRLFNPRTARRDLTATLSLGLVVLAACATETRVIRYNTILSGIPGAQSQMPVSGSAPSGYTDPTAVPLNQLVQEDETGKKTLVARSARHLMIHIHNTLEDNDKALFVDQVLSTLTKKECADRGVDPGDSFDFFQTRRDDIRALFNLMPAGEASPGVQMRQLSRSVWRVELPKNRPDDLHWVGFDMVLERGNWKLRWFIGNS